MRPPDEPAAAERATGLGSAAQGLNARERRLGLLVVVWAFLSACTPLENWDIWWQIKTGELIWSLGSVPQTDSFSFAYAGRPWIDAHWGFELLAFALYTAGGVPLLVVAKAACSALTVRFGWAASTASGALPAWLAAAVWLVVIQAFTLRSPVRPEMLSLVFLALWLWIAATVEARPRRIWWLPAITLAWVNSHGLFVLGIVIGAIWLLDRLARHFGRSRFWLAPPATCPTWARLGLVACLVGGAAFVNPYGLRGVLFPLVLFEKLSVTYSFYSEFVQECQPLALFLGKLEFWPVVTLWLATLASFAWLARERRLDLARLALFAAFSWLGWSMVRNVVLLVLVAGVVLCQNLAAAAALRRARIGKADRRVEALSTPLTLALTGVTLAASFWALASSLFGAAPRVWPVQRPGVFAHEAMRFAGREGMPTRAFIMPIGQAAIYIFHNGPERKVFLDGRLEVASLETAKTFLEIAAKLRAGDRSWEAPLRDAAGELPALILHRRRASLQIDGLIRTPGWRCVYIDQIATVFLDDVAAERLGLPPIRIRTEKRVQPRPES